MRQYVELFFDKKDAEILKRLVFLVLRRHDSWCRNNNNVSLFRISTSFLSKNDSRLQAGSITKALWSADLPSLHISELLITKIAGNFRTRQRSNGEAQQKKLFLINQHFGLTVFVHEVIFFVGPCHLGASAFGNFPQI